MEIISEIKKIAAEKKAIILAHNYQRPEIQDIADFSGDSLELSRLASKTEAEIIVFCGVHFMAESAAILSPDKKVLLPDPGAGCPMADMVDTDGVSEFKKKYPNAKVVTYINSSAAVKALSDVICTSSNAVKIVERIESDEILFLPDRNLAGYVQKFTKKKIIPWDGFCPTHENLTLDEVLEMKKNNPGAYVMAHPECIREIADIADGVYSTGGMIEFVKKTDSRKIIVCTELGMIHKLKKVAPQIEYIPATRSLICPNMKKITLEKLLASLIQEKEHITVDAKTAEGARKALQKMLELSY
jgi:quinolinate synthase